MSWLDDIAEGFAEGFVPAYNRRMDNQAAEDQSILEARIRGTQDTAKARREQEARDRQRLKMATGIVGATGKGDSGLVYGLLETYGDDPKTVTEMLLNNPVTAMQPTAVSQPAPTPTSAAPNEDFYVSSGTRATYKPSTDFLNISMDFNAAPNGNARGTEVIIPDNASPEVRAAADRYNVMVAEFASANGIADYPVRGVRTTSENGRGVSNTVHVEPFFNSDTAMQEAIKANPEAFANIYKEAFGSLPNARLIAPHGVGADRGAVSSVFGDETSYGELMATYLTGGGQNQPTTTRNDTDAQMGSAFATSVGTEPTQEQPTTDPADNLFMTALGFNQAERDRQIDTRFNQFADATGLNSDTGGFATPQSNFRLNMGPERADLPKISEVRASNYQALAAAAEQGGNPELAANITSLGEEMSSATPERQAVIQDAIENVGSSLSVINTRIGETQGTVNGFIGATDSAYNLINILKDQPDILTFFGGRVPSFISSVDNEVSALSTLLAETTSTDAADARVSNFESQIDARISEGTIDARAAAYAKYAAQEVRMAYMIVRSQQPTGPISQADFESAFQQVRTSSRSSTVEDSLRGIISADRINVTSMQDTLRNDPQVYGANRVLKEANITDFDPLGGLLKPIEEIAEARGAGDAMRWLSGDTNLIERQDMATPTEEQNTAQTTTPETVLEQARSAIARGADADAVRQRLIDNGYDASGL